MAANATALVYILSVYLIRKVYILIANEFIIKAVALIINAFLHLSLSIDLLTLVLESQV